MLKKIGSIINECKGPDEINSNYKKKLDWNKQVKYRVFNFLQHKNVIIWDKSDGTKFEINIDQMQENLKSIEENYENYKEQLSNMDFELH